MTEITTVKQRFGIIGNSPLLDRALEVALRVAPTDLANLCLACLYIWEQLMNLIKCSCYLIICLTWTLSILTCFFCCTNFLSTSNILRILSGERKLSKTKRIGTE